MKFLCFFFSFVSVSAVAMTATETQPRSSVLKETISKLTEQYGVQHQRAAQAPLNSFSSRALQTRAGSLQLRSSALPSDSICIPNQESKQQALDKVLFRLVRQQVVDYGNEKVIHRALQAIYPC